jgi:predicted helicase
MPAPALIKPTHKAIKQYYQSLKEYSARKVTHEGAVETAFQRLLDTCAHTRGWHLIPKQPLKVAKSKHAIAPDGTLRDLFNARCGFWEAKDTHDDLDVEISKKLAKGYPTSNTIFEDTRQAVLYQGGQERNRFDLADPKQLANLLNDFFSYTEPEIESFHTAVEEFKEAVPDLARKLVAIIATAHERDSEFKSAFAEFFALCQQTLNPNISQAAVDEMLVQHLLTERLIRKVFENSEFTRRNVIAAEIEKVIAALVKRSFDRDQFLKSLDRFYHAIEQAAHTLEDFSEKQQFLNTVYERFFQGYSVKVADTHGIVYTPQAIVDFMCASVEEVLKTEFGLTLGSKSVNILDPCTGTGNFIVNLIRRIPKRDLPRMYKEQLFANEVMLLPYYIAALNIEHAYFEITGEYQGFEGLCFVDTLDLVEEQGHFSFMTEANTARVERQKRTPITVVIGNPPYNVGQLNENDNNKNRKYPVIEKRIKETFAKDSNATSVSKLNDPYVKFFRWAIDRLERRNGIVCLITNNSFVEQIAFDGMRKHLVQEFTNLYHVQLEGNVRQHPKLSGTRYNVFGIQVGVGITVAVRNTARSDCSGPQKLDHGLR